MLEVFGRGIEGRWILLAADGFELGDFDADELFDLGVGEVAEPYEFYVAKSGGGIFRGDLAAVVEIFDVDARAGFETVLFFICHGNSCGAVGGLLGHYAFAWGKSIKSGNWFRLCFSSSAVDP